MSKKKVHIGIFNKYSEGADESLINKLQVAAEEAAKEVEYYFKWYCRHVWDVEVRGYAYEGEITTQPPYYGGTDITNFINDNPELFEDVGWSPNYLHVWGGYKAGVCGQGRLPGYRSVTYKHNTSPCGVKTMIHELGHNFGLWHASTRQGYDEDTRVEYGDRTSTMASVSKVTPLHGPNLIKLDAVYDEEKLDLTETRQVFLAPVEMHRHGMHPNEWQHVQFWDGNDKIHLSIRKDRGTYLPLSYNKENLYIHEVPHTQSVRVLGDLRPGGSRVLENGTTIEYVGYQDDMAKVNIIREGDEAPEDMPFPTTLPEPPTVDNMTERHTGLWYDPDFNGDGFDLQVKDGRAVLYWYTYEQKTKRRRFYYAQGTIDELQKGATLYTTTYGFWNDPSKHVVKEIGEVQVYFFNREHGVVNWHTEEHGRGGMEIVPVGLSEYSGIYYDRTRNGEGFTMQFFPDRMAALWYTYMPQGGYQEWYLCTGTKDDLTVYRCSDNKFMELRDDAGAEEIGKAVLTNDFKFTAEFDDGRSIELNLTKLF